MSSVVREVIVSHTEHEIERAEKLVAKRCEAAIARFLDICEASPDRPVLWGSDKDPWSFRVTLIDGNWVMDDIEMETEGMEDFFTDEELTSREGIDHVICSVLVPLAMDMVLGEVPGRTPEEFLSELENAVPGFDVE